MISLIPRMRRGWLEVNLEGSPFKAQPSYHYRRELTADSGERRRRCVFQIFLNKPVFMKDVE